MCEMRVWAVWVAWFCAFCLAHRLLIGERALPNLHPMGSPTICGHVLIGGGVECLVLRWIIDLIE